MSSSLVPATQVPTAEERHSFSGLAFRGGSAAERLSLTSEIGSPANRWFGENRGGWSNPEYDRLYQPSRIRSTRASAPATTARCSSS